MKVFITGLNGFIASRLAGWLAGGGHEITGTSRSGSERFAATTWRLGEPIDTNVLTGVDAIIHAAHDFTAGAMKTNVEGTRLLERVAAAAGVRHQILISSISARPDAVSEYGRTKLEEEKYFLLSGHTVIRPGTVLGKGGIFGKMAGLLERFPVMPLLDGGRSRMTIIGIDDLCRAIEIILEGPIGREYNLYYEQRPTLAEVLRLLRTILDRKVVFVPLPATLLLRPLGLLRQLGIRTPVDVDNLKGYMTNLAPYHPTNLSSVLAQPSSWQAALAEAWGRERLLDQPTSPTSATQNVSNHLTSASNE